MPQQAHRPHPTRARQSAPRPPENQVASDLACDYRLGPALMEGAGFHRTRHRMVSLGTSAWDFSLGLQSARMDVLVDLDGTLVDPKPGLIGSVQYALDRLGF